MVLSEYRNNESGHLIRTKLLLAGFVFQFGSPIEAAINGVLIASRKACSFTCYLGQINDFPEALIRAEMADLTVYGLYFPHKKKHTLFPFLKTQLAQSHQAQLLIGDFNTGKNFVDQKGDSFWYTEALKDLKRDGFLDAFRHLHGAHKEYSWVSAHGQGYRYDHCYVEAGLAPVVKQCYYDHEVRSSNLSDHSAMIVDLMPIRQLPE